MKKLLFFVAFLFFVVACTPLRTLKYLAPDLNDSSKFVNAKIIKSATPLRFLPYQSHPQYQTLRRQLDSNLIGTKTKVFLVIKNDSIIYEYLSKGENLNHLQASFSMSKSYVGTLMGIAIDKGYIKSTEELVIKYLPGLAKNDSRFSQLTIQHVLDMRSGFKYNEKSFTPFAKLARSYYGADTKRIVSHLKMKNNPGEKFEYQSISTQVLSMILEKATGRNIASLLEEWLWNPLGTESNALWSMDDYGEIKAFCCISATALDYAKLGRLYLKGGNWQGNQLISKRWINQTTNPDTLRVRPYKNHFWATEDYHFFNDSIKAVQELKNLGKDYPVKKHNNGKYFYAEKVYDYMVRGMYNQIIYVNTKNNVIIVRLGEYQKDLKFNKFIPKIGRLIK